MVTGLVHTTAPLSRLIDQIAQESEEELPLSSSQIFTSPAPLRISTTSQEATSLAIESLRAEAWLTPKPGLVDRRGSGSHNDMNLDLLLLSISILEPGFLAMTRAAYRQPVGLRLRAQLASIGRSMERTMLQATRGVNTHRGAIWALGLLASAAVVDPANRTPKDIAGIAARIARLPDQVALTGESHGQRAVSQYGGGGALGEARAAFPHVLLHGLPRLRASRLAGANEDAARLDTLLAIMSHLPDTCLLHRGGRAALQIAQTGAAQVLAQGGMISARGREAMRSLDQSLLKMRVSPGGSADLLAATLFLDGLAAA